MPFIVYTSVCVCLQHSRFFAEPSGMCHVHRLLKCNGASQRNVAVAGVHCQSPCIKSFCFLLHFRYLLLEPPPTLRSQFSPNYSPNPASSAKHPRCTIDWAAFPFRIGVCGVAVGTPGLAPTSALGPGPVIYPPAAGSASIPALSLLYSASTPASTAASAPALLCYALLTSALASDHALLLPCSWSAPYFVQNLLANKNVFSFQTNTNNFLLDFISYIVRV